MQLFYPLIEQSGNIGVPGYHQQEYNKSYTPKDKQNQASPPFIGTLDHLCSRSTTDTISTEINSRISPNHYTTIFPNLFNALSQSCSNGLSKALLPRDIIFFSQILALYQLELRKGNDSVVYSSEKLARLLGFNSSLSCNMRSVILKTTRKLEELGLLEVKRSVTYSGRNKTNELVPLLPDSLYKQIKDSSYNFSISDSDKLGDESNLDHILRTKLFVPLDLGFLKNLFADNISPKYKVFLLNCIISAYRNYKLSGNLSFSATSKELMQNNNISRSTLDRIFSYIKNNTPNFFIKIEHKYTKSDDIDSNRWDKSIFSISVDPLVFHDVINKDFSADNIDCSGELDIELEKEVSCYLDKISSKNVGMSTNNSRTYKGVQVASSKKPPSVVKKEALIIKKKEIKKKYYKDIDYIDAKSDGLDNITCIDNLNSKNSSKFNLPGKLLDRFSVARSLKEEELENEQSSFSSESYKNSSFAKDLEVRHINKSLGSDTTKGNKGKHRDDTTPYKELRHFYPLSDKDISNLNFYAEREFSSNFVNQLLLKLYIKYPEKKFKNKFTFLSYMKKLLKNEKHQGPLVNHTSFRFSCNINEEDKNMLYYERYLTEIENSFDTSKEMQIKKKIAGRFNTKLAYAILKQVIFKINIDNSFITALIPKNQNPTNRNLYLSESQIETLSEQLEAVYGKNGYYVECGGDRGREECSVGYEKTPEYEEKDKYKDTKNWLDSDNYKNGKETSFHKNLPTVNESKIITLGESCLKIKEGVPLSKIPTTTSWYHIRKELIEELGINTDKAWFSKVIATEDKEKSTLILTMPTIFMADWVRNNYSHVILRLVEGCGVKRVEYGYE